MDSGERIAFSCGIPASTLIAFNSAAELEPNKSPVFPVIICPSGNSIATAGAPVASARANAGFTV